MTYWTIKAPDGRLLLLSCLARTARGAVEQFELHYARDWESMEDQGYHCVRVKIEEV